MRRRPERDPAPIIIGGTVAFLAVVILLVVGVSTLLGGGDGGNGGSSRGQDGESVDFGGISGRLISSIPALPPGLNQLSAYIEFELDQENPPNISGFVLPLRETVDDPAGLGFYTFVEGRWRRVADVKVVRNGRAEGEFNEVPPNIVVLRVAPQPYQVAAALPAGGSLHPEARATIVSPRDYAPVQDGTVQGTPTAFPPDRQFLVIPTIVGSGEDAAAVVNDILADEGRRNAHLQAIASLVNDQGLDGIDLEYSSVDVDLEPEFTEFVTTLAERLGEKRLSLTLPPPSNQQRQAYEWKKLGEAVDMIKILPIADPVSYWDTMPRAISEITEQVDAGKVMLVISPYSIEGVGDVTQPIGYLQAMVLAAESAVREPQKPEDIKPGTNVKLVATNLDQAEGASSLRWDEAAAAVRFDLGGTERRRIVIENAFSVGFKLEIVQAYRLGGIAVSDASAQSDVANIWPVINELMRSATLTLQRPNESSLLPIWQAPDGGDFGAGAGTTATWIAPKQGPHNIVLVVSDGERRFGRVTLVEVREGPKITPTPLITFPPPTPSPSPSPAPGQPPATPSPAPQETFTLKLQVGKRVDGDDSNSDDPTADFKDKEATSPGSEVEYRIVIDNDSDVEVTITSLVDDKIPNVACVDKDGNNLVGLKLAKDDGDAEITTEIGDDSRVCRFKTRAPAPPFNDPLTNTVTVRTQDASGNKGIDHDGATIVRQ